MSLNKSSFKFDRIPVDSSTCDCVFYCPEFSVLQLSYKDRETHRVGRVYNVTPKMLDAMLKSESIGKYYRLNFRDDEWVVAYHMNDSDKLGSLEVSEADYLADEIVNAFHSCGIEAEEQFELMDMSRIKFRAACQRAAERLEGRCDVLYNSKINTVKFGRLGIIP